MNKLFPLKSLVMLVLSWLPFALAAEPAPFGLILNKTTVEELKSKFKVTHVGINKNNALEAYDINPKDINFDGLISIRVAFSDDGILKLVQMTLPKTKFEEIFNSLNSKYSLLYKNVPADGTKEAKFEKDNSYILLYAASNTNDMDFLYSNKKILDDALQIQPAPLASRQIESTVGQL